MLDHPRRRILCIRPRRAVPGMVEGLGPIDWVDTLARQADVTIIEQDDDLARLCAGGEPDLIVLEGLSEARPWPTILANPHACPAVPRVLMLTGEPYDPLRGLSFRLADALDIDTVFVPGDAHRQHMPDLAFRSCHLVPLTADVRLCGDQIFDKVIPVTVLDSTVEPEFNPWRTALLSEIRLAMPTLAFARGPAAVEANAFPLAPDARARLIGQSWFCAVDTTRLDRVSVDHLAIPAAGSVLLAPPSDALAAYGFVDGLNCLLGSGQDLIRKVDSVARAPAEYARIREAGMALVRGRHGGDAPHVLLGWLDCRRRLKPGQVAQQVDRYGPFRAVTPTVSTPSVLASPMRDSVMTKALRTTQAALLAGERLIEALPVIDEAARSSPQVAEPLFLLSILALLNGNPVEAAMGIGSRAEKLGARDDRLAAFDPVEVAWLLLVTRLIGHAPLEAAMREQAALIRHVSLRRVFWLLDAAAEDVTLDESLLERRPDDYLSVHWLGQEDFPQWADLVRRVLMANRATPGHAAVARRFLAAA